MGRGRLFAVLLLSLGLTGCGPKTIVSTLNPLRYTVTTVVDFHDGDQVTRQVVVTHCKVVDQTDSVAANYNIDETGDGHWFKRADGSIWLVGRLDPCRWYDEKPVGQGVTRPVTPDIRYDQPERGWPLRDEPVYRLDKLDDPTFLEIHGTDAMFGGGVDGLSARGQLGVGGGEATDVLRSAFLWLGRLEAEAPARWKAERKARSNRADPLSFGGYVVEVQRLRGGLRCPAPDPKAKGPIVLTDVAARECIFNNGCPEAGEPTYGCADTLGRLRPRFDDDYRTIRFSDPERIERYGGTLVRMTVLEAAGALSRSHGQAWMPNICLEDACGLPGQSQRVYFYYPSRDLLVTARFDQRAPESGWPIG